MKILDNVNNEIDGMMDGAAKGVKRVSRVVFREFPISMLLPAVFLLPVILVGIIYEALNGRYIESIIAISILLGISIILIPLFLLAPRIVFCSTNMNYKSVKRNTLIQWESVSDFKFECINKRGYWRKQYFLLNISTPDM